jgi:hypothetical protein
MTTFGDQVYQYGGVPVGVGETPITGSTFFVDSANGNDGNTGKSTSSALATYEFGTCHS